MKTIPFNPLTMTASDLVDCASRMRDIIEYAKRDGITDAQIAAFVRSISQD